MKGLRKKVQGKPDPIPPIETSGGPRPENNEINRFLAQYNRTSNALALWAAFRVCLQHDRPLPRRHEAILPEDSRQASPIF